MNSCLRYRLDSINYLKPSTALYMAHISELQDFDRGPSVVRGTSYDSHAWSGGPSVAATLSSGDRLCRDHRWHDSPHTLSQ